MKNLANKLTVFRIILVPVILFFLLCEAISQRYIFALAVFLIASFTDYLDGKIARKSNTITNFGKIVDPLADKILICSMLICFVEFHLIPALAVAIIVAREFIVTSVRFLVLDQNKTVISANLWGKLKTFSQILTIIFILLVQVFSSLTLKNISFDMDILIFIQNVLIWCCMALSVISGCVYIYENRSHIKF